jgi:hypothetical protein
MYGGGFVWGLPPVGSACSPFREIVGQAYVVTVYDVSSDLGEQRQKRQIVRTGTVRQHYSYCTFL